MKKIFLMTLLSIFSIYSVSLAAFIDENQNIISIASAKEMKDNTPVRIKGNIVKNLGDEKYQFTDGKETIIVEIDNEDWKGKDVSANDTVIIIGEIDQEFLETKIDVDAIEIVK